MKILTRAFPDALVATVDAPRIDAMAAVEFKDSLCACCTGAPPRIILDLGNVTFVDSSGLGAIIGAMKLLAPERKLELAALQPAVTKVFNLTRMDQIFTIHDTLDDARSGLSIAS